MLFRVFFTRCGTPNGKPIRYNHLGLGVLVASAALALVTLTSSTSGNNDGVLLIELGNNTNTTTAFPRWSYFSYAISWAGIEFDTISLLYIIYIRYAAVNADADASSLSLFGRKGSFVRASVPLLGFLAIFAATFVSGFAYRITLGILFVLWPLCTLVNFVWHWATKWDAMKSQLGEGGAAGILIVWLVQVCTAIVSTALIATVFFLVSSGQFIDNRNTLFYLPFYFTQFWLAAHVVFSLIASRWGYDIKQVNVL